MKWPVLICVTALLCACSPAPAPEEEETPPAPAAPAIDVAPPPPATPPPAGDDSTQASVGFVDKVWTVESSTAVAAGTHYAFLADGTLAIGAPQQRDSFGRWSYARGKLVMIEEGVEYPTDIVALDEAHFALRSHNPGGTVDIRLVPAPDVALPKAPKK